MSILVLGIGNVLLSDEGVGVMAVAELQKRYRMPADVELLDGGTAGFELLTYIRDKTHLIIIDALKSGHSPGAVIRLAGAAVPSAFVTRISPHQLGLSDVLAAARLNGEMPANLVLFGVEPKSLDTGCTLSKEVSAAFEELLSRVINELRQLGHRPVPLPKGAIAAAPPDGMWRYGCSASRLEPTDQ